MIRLFTIFCKLNQLPFSDRQWMEQDISGFCSCGAACPFCGAKGCLDIFAHYERYLVELQAGRPVTYRVKIPRYRCASCAHTHALLSSCLVPYRSYSLRLILHVLRCYFLRLKTVTGICEEVGITPATLYQWKNVFLRQKALWLGALCDLERSASSFLSEVTGDFLKGFSNTFGFSLLQHMPGTDREVPPGRYHSEGAIT